jgi:molybdopterin synthase catalytic subunit
VPIWKKEILSKGDEKWVEGKSIKTNWEYKYLIQFVKVKIWIICQP